MEQIPRITEVVHREGHLQKEIIETLSNPYLFKFEELPIVKCLKSCRPECNSGGRHEDVAFNIYPLYELEKYKKYKFQELIMEKLKDRIPGLDIGNCKSLWAYSKTLGKNIKPSENDKETLLKYSVANAIQTEFDVYIAFKNMSCALELKLNSNFVDKKFIYQPWRQLFQLSLMNLIYGRDVKQCYVYLVTMEDDKIIEKRVNDKFPEHLSDFISMKNMKILSWRMIKEWLAKETRQNKNLQGILSRLEKYYIDDNKNTRAESSSDNNLLLTIEKLGLKQRKSSAGNIIEYDGKWFIWYNKNEIDVSLPLLNNYLNPSWAYKLEAAGFKPTPKGAYWKHRYSGSIPSDVEIILIKMLKELPDTHKEG